MSWNRRCFAFLVLLSTGLFTTSARAADAQAVSTPVTVERPERVYLTATYAITAVAKGAGDYIVLQPIGGELGFRPDRRVELGVSFDYGASTTSMSCKDCDARRWHGALRTRVHLVGDGHFVDPWLGGGLAYERLSVPKQNATGHDPFGGIDLIVEVGVDLKITRGLKFGPRVAAELAFRDPEAPAWAMGSTTWPYSIEFGVRLGYGF